MDTCLRITTCPPLSSRSSAVCHWGWVALKEDFRTYAANNVELYELLYGYDCGDANDSGDEECEEAEEGEENEG